MITRKLALLSLFGCVVILPISSSWADRKVETGEKETPGILAVALQAPLDDGDSSGLSATSTCDPSWIGDGKCDAGCNNRANNYDGGDCCPGTCQSGRTYPCGYDGYNCVGIATPTPTPTPVPSVSQITVDGTTCDEVSSGSTDTLSTVTYDVDNKGKTKDVKPAKFIYWTKVTVPAGNNTFVVTQAITTSNFASLFKVDGGGDVTNVDGCKGAGGAGAKQDTTSGASSTVTVKFNAKTAGDYYIALKFQTASVNGVPAPGPGSTVHYNFSTFGVAGSESGVDLVKQ